MTASSMAESSRERVFYEAVTRLTRLAQLAKRKGVTVMLNIGLDSTPSASVYIFDDQKGFAVTASGSAFLYSFQPLKSFQEKIEILAKMIKESTP